MHDPDSLYGTGVIYRTAVLGDETIALRKAALSPTKHPNGDAGRLDRYEIAIWKTERSGSPMYWVGIETHDDSVHEFLARLLYTDHLFGLGYDSWKKVISPSCKSK